ncbi:hypothetical protein [Chakrabartyella piscis]|uniref:hypothetical protein n=1 Tax=Chakrabartyella piscis TaxID=2918914 RepID=UPI002958A1B1|nr:hypothetical protein [Chakrabartyella piscis]
MKDGLTLLLEKAKGNPMLQKTILATKQEKDPTLALCELATKEGCPVTVGQVYERGEWYLAQLSESRLGVTEPRAVLGDVVGEFYAAIEGLKL